MIRRPFSSFLRDGDGSTSVEFVVVFLGFIAIFLFVVEVTLYLFFIASLEKAAEAGVRAAVVSPPVVSGFPSTIARVGSATYGTKCAGTGACAPLSTFTCTGASCRDTPFSRILAHMQGFNGRIRPENVTFTYSDAGIGFAGGPSVPMVTVTIRGVPFQTGILGLLLNQASDAAILDDLRTLPPRSASMTGEDLAL